MQRNHGTKALAKKNGAASCLTTPLKVFVTHRRHTEGVGEMYEDQARWVVAHGEVWIAPFLVSPSAETPMMVKLEPSSRRRPPSFTRADTSWWIIDPTATTAGPCDAIFGSCDAEDRRQRRLLLLPTLRLFRCLLRHCFRPSLLRHCCPPSLSGWRHRYSAAANRPALASAYTSAEKKTAFPLNFVYGFRFAPSRCVGRAIHIQTCR